MYKVTLCSGNNNFKYVEVEKILVNNDNIKLMIDDNMYNKNDILTLNTVDKIIIEII